MPQSPERKREYAKERLAANGDAMRAAAAEWRGKNREYLADKSTARRLSKRAMCLAAAARVRARSKGVPFALTGADIATLQAVIDAGRCELSGVAFTLTGQRSATSPSLDRRNPTFGYVTGNVRVVCHALNAGMGDWGDAELLRIARAWIAKADGNAIVPQVAAVFVMANLSISGKTADTVA